MYLKGDFPVKKFLACSLTLVLTLCLAVAAFAAREQSFIFSNDSQYTVDELYVCPAASDDWQEDILGRDTAAPGDSYTIYYSRNDQSRLWAILVVFKSGKQLRKEDVELAHVREVSVQNGSLRIIYR